MSTPALNVDVAAAMLARLPGQFVGKPKIEGMLTALASPIQTLRDSVMAMITQLSLDVATGVQLDRLGKILVYPRNGLGDADYRKRLRVAVLVRRSTGKRNELLQIVKLFIDNADAVITTEDIYGAAFIITVDGVSTSPSDRTDLVAFVKQAAHSGIRVIVNFVNSEDFDSFAFSLSTYFTPANTAIGASTISVGSTVGFPETGTLLLAAGDISANVEETVTYTSKTATTFVLASPTTKAHLQNTDVQLKYGDAAAFGSPFPVDTALSSATLAGATSLPVYSTAQFPAGFQGVAIAGGDIFSSLEEGAGVTRTDGTHFTASPGLVLAHAQNTSVVSTEAGGLFITDME